MLDFHNHLMPGVDDGAADVSEARTGLQALVSDGVRHVITTPHCSGSLTARPIQLGAFLAALDRAWESLTAMAAEDFPKVGMSRAVELMLDTPDPDLSDPRVRLAGTRFVLIEFPHMSIPPNSARVIGRLADHGWCPVIAHPERYSNMKSNLDLPDAWRASGAYLQLNAGSLTGRYGSAPRELAWRLVHEGLIDYMCSDYHSRGRCYLKPAADELLVRSGAAQLERMTVTNPARLLRDESPLPVEPLELIQLPLWRRIFSRR